MIKTRNFADMLTSGRVVASLGATAALFWLAATTYYSSFDPRSRCEVQFRQDWDPAAAVELDTNIPLSRHCNTNFDIVPPWVNIVLIAVTAMFTVLVFALVTKHTRRR